MKKVVFTLLFVFVFLSTSLFASPPTSHAAASCGDFTFNLAETQFEFTVPDPRLYLLDPTETVGWLLKKPGLDVYIAIQGNSKVEVNRLTHTILINGKTPGITSGDINKLWEVFTIPGTRPFDIDRYRIHACTGSVTIISDLSAACTNQHLTDPANGAYFLPGEGFFYNATVTNLDNTTLVQKVYDANGDEVKSITECNFKTDATGNFNNSFQIPAGAPGAWSLAISIHKPWSIGCVSDGDPLCTFPFQMGTASSGNGSQSTGIKEICTFIKDGTQQKRCLDCAAGALTGGKPGVLTPFGCIEADLQGFIQKLLKIAISVAGGIAFLMIIYGGFVTMTSSGNPERLTTGKEIITSAIAGLLLIIFSVVILKIIGVDILVLPGLSP